MKKAGGDSSLKLTRGLRTDFSQSLSLRDPGWVLRFTVVVTKLQRDFNLVRWFAWFAKRGWRGSDSCFALSASAAPVVRTAGGAMPIIGYRFAVGVGLRHPVAKGKSKAATYSSFLILLSQPVKYIY